MIPIQRKSEIYNLIKRKKVCSIKDIKKDFEVSNVTIHRILNELESERLIEKVHGGAILKDHFFIDGKYYIRKISNVSKKIEIAKKGITYINDGLSVFLDSTTTSYILAKEIMQNDFNDLTVITNSPFTVSLLSNNPKINIISTGGEFNYLLNGFAGTFVMDFIKKVQCDKAFLSFDGISLDNGLMLSQPIINEIIKKVIDNSDEVNVLMDSTKFDKRAVSITATLEDVDRLITNKDIKKNIIDRYKKNRIEIVF